MSKEHIAFCASVVIALKYMISTKFRHHKRDAPCLYNFVFSDMTSLYGIYPTDPNSLCCLLLVPCWIRLQPIINCTTGQMLTFTLGMGMLSSSVNILPSGLAFRKKVSSSQSES